MLQQPIIDDLTLLKLHGMKTALEGLQAHQQLAEQSLLEGLGLLLSEEKLYRDNKRQARLQKTAKLRFATACIEDIDYTHQRGLKKAAIQCLQTPQWITQASNVVLIGATGLGKTYLACALGQFACRRGFSVRYFRVSKLLEQLRMASVDGTLQKLIAQLAKVAVLILDDWGLEPLNQQQRHWLLDIVEDRHLLHSTIITTQLPTEHWHDYIGDNTVADAMLDRLLSGQTNTITLRGQSMRQTKS